MDKSPMFADFDHDTVYIESKLRAQNESTRNFVVEFGKGKAHIAFDLGVGDIQGILESERKPETPVRWINIWSPNRQTDLIELLGKHYIFSPRLLAIIKEIPPDRTSDVQDKNSGKYKTLRKDDVETGASSIDSQRATELSPSQSKQIIRQYDVAKQWINLQSIDVGARFTCIGANWMHELPHLRKEASLVDEGSQRRLWSWLVLCDDSTVISIHEDPGPVNHVEDLKSMRGNTLSVLSQLSSIGNLSADPTSMQSVRQALDANPGVEGASNLFYYLFDDWRAVYSTIAAFRSRLESLQHDILVDMTRKSHKPPNIKIIPRLHILGGQIRQMQGLYEGYHNLIQRIMEPKHTTIQGTSFSRSMSGLGAGVRGVVLAESASLRFERLGDRIQLLILSGTKEFLAEKEALISMYFNINTQKDSEATARLTRSATLLAKLSVLFLPVSLMTSYFSVQISDIQGVYTIKEYWIVFAIIMSISFLGLFFFSRLLMWVTETLDERIKSLNRALARLLFRWRVQKDE